MLDIHHCGYPDMSYHGLQAWKAELENYNHHVGIMYSCPDENGKGVKLWYVAYNMHWEKKQFSLPKLMKEQKWKVVMTTGERVKEIPEAKKSSTFEVEERSITIFEA